MTKRNVQRIPWFWFLLLAALIIVPNLSGGREEYVQDVSQRIDERIELQEGGYRYRQVALLLLAAGGTAAMFRRKGRRLSWNGSTSATLVIFVSWCALSVFWSSNPSLSTRRLLVLALSLLGALGIAARWRPAIVARFVAFSAVLSIIIGLGMELTQGRFAPWDPAYRFAGFFMPNSQGQVCALLVLTALIGTHATRGFKTMYRFLAVSGIAFLLLTRSRTSLAGLVAGLLAFSLIVLPKNTKWRLVYLTVSITLICILIAGSYIPQMVLLGRDVEEATTLTGRTPLWSSCFHFVKQHPLIGFGYEAFWTPEHIEDISFDVNWTVASAHSAYLELLLNLGAIGLLGYMCFLATAYIRARRNFRESRSGEYAVVAALVVMLFVFGLLESTVVVIHTAINFLFLILICSVAFGKLSENEVDSESHTR